MVDWYLNCKKKIIQANSNFYRNYKQLLTSYLAMLNLLHCDPLLYVVALEGHCVITISLK
jgi:hypothetical protein